MNAPQLNADDQKKAEKNAKNGSGKSQASDASRKQAAQSCGSVGGFISQEAGAEIAKSEGYEKTIKTISTELLIALRAMQLSGVIHCNIK